MADVPNALLCQRIDNDDSENYSLIGVTNDVATVSLPFVIDEKSPLFLYCEVTGEIGENFDLTVSLIGVQNHPLVQAVIPNMILGATRVRLKFPLKAEIEGDGDFRFEIQIDWKTVKVVPFSVTLGTIVE